MNSWICYSLLLPFVNCTSSRLNCFQQNIVDLYGENTNLPKAESIIREEAKRIGLSTAYFDTCSTNVKSLFPSERERATIHEEAVYFPRARFKSKDQVLPLLAVRAPKFYAVIMQRLALMEKYLVRIDPAARAFVQKGICVECDPNENVEAGDIILEEIVRYSNTENSTVNFTDMVLALNKITTKYQTLPQMSKKSLERTFCVNTSFRILNDQHKLQKLLAKLSNIGSVGGFV